MTLPIANLDDRRYEDILHQLQTHIPRYAPEWTNHNASDPGITILEMLVWVSEMVMYRMNRVSPAHFRAFRQLIGETGETQAEVMLKLWKTSRAVTRRDYETLAREANPEKVANAKCLENRNLENTTCDERGHISMVIVPKTTGLDVKPVPDEPLKKEILDYLFSRRLITTRLHVVPPQYRELSIDFKVKPEPGVPLQQLETRITDRLREFLHPVVGGEDGKGWPFGKGVAISEIYRQIETAPGVDYALDAVLLPTESDGTEYVYLEEYSLPWLI